MHLLTTIDRSVSVFVAVANNRLSGSGALCVYSFNVIVMANVE